VIEKVFCAAPTNPTVKILTIDAAFRTVIRDDDILAFRAHKIVTVTNIAFASGILSSTELISNSRKFPLAASICRGRAVA